MRSRNACLQSSILLAALAVGLASASMSPAIHPGFSAVLRSRSLERFEPKVAAILLSSSLISVQACACKGRGNRRRWLS
jgi:hypothetical protein